MAVLQMQRISICAMKKDRKSILELLQQSGFVEADCSKREENGFEIIDTQNARSVFEKNIAVSEKALEIIEEYFPEKKTLLSQLNGKRLIEYEEYQKACMSQESIVDTANTLLEMDHKITELQAEICKIQDQIEMLEPWKPLDIPLNYAGTSSTRIIFGTCPPSVSIDEMVLQLENMEDRYQVAEVRLISEDKDQKCIAVIVLQSIEGFVEEILRSMGFARCSISGRNVPEEEIQLLQKKCDEKEKEIERYKKEICRMADRKKDIMLISDYYRTRDVKYQVLGSLSQSKKTFLFTGYIPKNEAHKLQDLLEGHFDLVVDISDLEPDEDMPIMLKNNRFSSNFEGIVASYGLPQKGEIDPTTIMSFCYFFLFGMMLSDAAYGAIIFFGCLFVVKRFPNMDEGLKKTLNMFKWCGLSTLIWGVLFGGYFGDLFDVIAKNWFHVPLAEGQNIIPALWFTPISQPMKLLIYCLLFGIIHLYLGLAMKAYSLLKAGKVKDMIFDVLSWYVFLTGLIFLLLPTSLFYGMSQMYFPPVLGVVGKYMAIIGAVVIVLMSARRKKKIGLRIVMGLYDLYGVTSWLSDLLSYSRLLALGLATGVIAQVINQMASMFGTGVIGTILFTLIVIVGTVLNLAINLLGAYVHTNRLQYVEFFNKFYEGGGRPFQPFRTNTKYVDIKEEIKL